MKSKWMLFLFLLLMIGCTSSYNRGSVSRKYAKLDRKLDQLMDDEIDEDRRSELEQEFREFSNGMMRYKIENHEEDTGYLNEYIKKAGIRLEYLKDLKD